MAKKAAVAIGVLWEDSADRPPLPPRLPRAMSTNYIPLIVFVLIFVAVIAVAMIRTKARHRRIRKALGLPAKMETSTAEAQARHAVRVFQETDQRLSTTARRLSKEERRRMATAIVKEKGLLPKARPTE
jgi:Tfp pilus assembly protein PilX